VEGYHNLVCCQHFGVSVNSLSQLMQVEREHDGALRN
jgi:hypothetical protein